MAADETIRVVRHALLASVAALCFADSSVAQRVHIPTPSTNTFAPPASPQTVAPPAFGPAPLGASPGAIGPPQIGDPYAAGGVFSPPPPAVPYNYTPPLAPAQPGVAPLGSPQPFGQPQPTQPIVPDGFPLSWEPGTYGFQQGDGSLVRFTRVCQALDGEYTHLFGGNDSNDLSLNRIEVSSTFAWPAFGNIDSPILLTPGFVYNEFDDNSVLLLPNEVYEAYLDAAWYPQLGEGFGAELGLRTGVWSDLDEVSSDSIRILGRGLAVWRIGPAAEFLAGVVYLDRRRIKLLPAGGIRWKPTPDVEVNAVFPNPVVRKRLRTDGVTDWWGFVAGEYGGGSWTDELFPDGFDYNDIRVSCGVEFETRRQITGFFEVGFVFEREFYLPGGVVPEFEETVMLRAGINL